MPARDIFHDEFVNALDNDDWTITDDPLYIRFGEEPLYVDLAAERLIAAEKEERKIAVEIKSFLGTSFAADFHLAVGQFVNYRIVLQEDEPDRTLYLAIPLDAYKTFFIRKLARTVVEQQSLKLIVFDPQEEEIVEWIE